MGLNLRKIMLQTNKVSVKDLRKSDITELVYHPTSPDVKWKESIVNELIQVRDNTLKLKDLNMTSLLKSWNTSVSADTLSPDSSSSPFPWFSRGSSCSTQNMNTVKN